MLEVWFYALQYLLSVTTTGIGKDAKCIPITILTQVRVLHGALDHVVRLFERRVISVPSLQNHNPSSIQCGIGIVFVLVRVVVVVVVVVVESVRHYGPHIFQLKRCFL